MIGTIVIGVVAVGAYLQSRGWVRRRLRFVDAVQNPVAPIVAGTVAAVIAAPVVWLLPWVGLGTALLFGGGIGLGVLHGARDIRRLPPV